MFCTRPPHVSVATIFEISRYIVLLMRDKNAPALQCFLISQYLEIEVETPDSTCSFPISMTIRKCCNRGVIGLNSHKIRGTLRSALVHLKDHLPANRTKDCVYKIKCNDYHKVPIGQTAREPHIRVGENGRKIIRPPRNADEYQALLKDSAIALDTGHKIDLENVEVLRRGLRSTSQRPISKGVKIAKHPSINRIEGMELTSVWRTVLDQSC
ncbi:hypothetical protein T265_09668 [Opisthorchis viverrini]|uniref:Uncharacterized protein n=1 Tax=Opisthorchis viverrini TaxID=6198 RepID=A0A074Z515_OPIVI|nr:hypothetical protein T265_09668 [Opisthorchis viverrini]KER22161.1 hypothetical protein T265_09668 [Opisthorchis viverrini]